MSPAKNMQLKDIPLVLLWFVSVVLLLYKTKQITNEGKRVKIKEPDGSLRKPTIGERMAIADKMAYEKGKYFWWLVLILALITTVIIVLGLIGVFS